VSYSRILMLFLGYRGPWGLLPFSPCDVMMWWYSVRNGLHCRPFRTSDPDQIHFGGGLHSPSASISLISRDGVILGETESFDSTSKLWQWSMDVRMRSAGRSKRTGHVSSLEQRWTGSCRDTQRRHRHFRCRHNSAGNWRSVLCWNVLISSQFMSL